MKKIICSILMVVLMSVMLVTAAFAAGTSVTVSDATAKPGDVVTLDVAISGNTGFGAATFDIVYDADVLTLTDIGVADKLFGQGTGVQNVAKNRVNCASATGITGDGVLFTLTFTVAADAANGEYDVSVVVKNFADTAAANIEATVVSGTVAVHKCVCNAVAAAPADCTNNGNIAYYVCECGKVYTDAAYTNEITLADTVIKAFGHDWAWVTDKEASCGVTGQKHEKCNTCGATQSMGTVINPTGDHVWSWIIDKDATCAEAGKKHEECSGCGAKRNDTLFATVEHEYEWVLDKEPTETEEGEQHEECKGCGAKRNEGTKIPATGPIPPTGDNFVFYLLLALISVAVSAVVIRYTAKRRVSI